MPMQALKRAAFMLPPLRRLRDRAARSDMLSAALEAARDRLGSVPAETQRQVLDAALGSARPGSFFRTRLNGEEMELPVETLRTMVHCLHPQPDRRLDLWVETAHLEWMLARMAPGGTFLDVGAATGATTLPAATRFGGALRILAYEPAGEARRLLEATVARNALAGIEIRPVAVSDSPGQAVFRELLADESGETPWLPESSSLLGGRMAEAPCRDVTVEVVTLDAEMARLGGLAGDVVVKIDVEGYEAPVLRGAVGLIARHRPPFAIDIHVDPFGDGQASTEAAVRALLEPAGYACRREAHVLLCDPRG